MRKLILLLILSLCAIYQAYGQLENACKHNEFRCAGGTGCLKTEKLCNGIEDCPEGEDERGNKDWDCSKVTLGTDASCNPAKQYRCRFGGCVPKEYTCNGNPDCWGGTDEAIELCAPKKKRPTPGGPSPAGPKPKPAPQPVRRPTPPPVEESQEGEELEEIPQPVPERRTRPTAPPTTTTTRPTQPAAGSCPPLEPEGGVDINCSKGAPCLSKPVSDGTRAEYKCKKHFIRPLTASETHERVCRKGKWSTRNKRWHCSLDCGEANHTAIGFLVGGFNSVKGKYPWHVGFYQQDPPGSGKYEFFCGGTLVSEDAVLTAAHCVTRRQTADKREDEIVLYLGKFFRSFNNNDQYVQKRTAREIEIHENYNPSNYDADIAIVWLSEKAEITDRVRPVCLAKDDDNTDPDPEFPGTLVGWGRAGTASKRVFVEQLQEARLPIIGRRACQKAHPALAQLTRDTTFCAGYKNGTSACDGDSGGGLVFEDPQIQNKYRIQGIVSAGVNHFLGGCDAKFYTVFTKVTSFLDWIHEMLDRELERKRKR